MAKSNDYKKLLKYLIQEKGGTPEQYERLLNLISFHETGGTMDPTTIQKSDKTKDGVGPGRGMFQLEGKDAGGSNRLLTSANRTANYYKELGLEVPEDIRRIQSGEVYDATQLHPDVQKSLVLGDLRMKKGVDLKDYVSGKLSPEDLWVDHWWSGDKSKRQEQKQKFVKDIERFDDSFQNVVEYPENKQNSLLSSLFKYGGLLNNDDKKKKELNPNRKLVLNYNKRNILKYGGDMNTNKINIFNEGGSHEASPLGGIPLGLNAQGQQNMVEEGEAQVDDKIYSDRIPLSKEVLKSVGLPEKYANKTPADILKKIDNLFKDRNDNASKNTKKDYIDKVFQAQELLKQQVQNTNNSLGQNSQEVPDMMNGNIPQGMGEFVQPEQESLPMEQDGRLQTGMQEQTQSFRNGGKMNKYFMGGNLGEDVLSGVYTGASLGSIIPGLGTGIGAGVGALVSGIGGVFQKNKREKEQLKKNINQNLGEHNRQFQNFEGGGEKTKFGEWFGDNKDKVLNTGLRLAPIVSNIAQIGKLKKQGYDTFTPTLNTQRFVPKYIDEESIINKQDSNLNNVINTISESGGSEGAVRNTVLAASNQRNKAVSDAVIQSRGYNNQMDVTRQQFNSGINEANINRITQAKDFTGSNKAAYQSNLSNLNAGLFTDVGNIGKERTQHEMLKNALGYNMYGEYVQNNPEATDEEAVEEVSKEIQQNPNLSAEQKKKEIETLYQMIMSKAYGKNPIDNVLKFFPNKPKVNHDGR